MSVAEEDGSVQTSGPPGLVKTVKRPSPVPVPSVNASPDTPAFLAQVEAAMVEHLQKRPHNEEHCPKMGIFLRGRGLNPQDGLKKFITARPQKFTYIEEGNGSNKVALVRPASVKPAAEDFGGLPPGMLPPGVDEKILERQLVSFVVEREATGQSVNMPSMGEFCIKHLGFSMKGALHRFVATRPHLFILPDDGRQLIRLQQGAAEALGVTGDLPSLPDYSEVGGAVRPGGSSAGVAAGAKYRSQRPSEYSKWDRVTQEMYDYVVANGGAVPFKEVDAFMRGKCSHLIEAQGIPLDAWQAQRHSWKRRNIFRKEGPLLAVHESLGGGGASGSSGAAANGGVEAAEDQFPPLPGAKLPPLPRSAINGAGKGASVAVLTGGGSGGGGAAAAEAWVAERRAMEALRDEITSNLASLKALSELQKENAGLRAACVTLGRELLGVKDEVAAIKAQLAASPVTVPATRTVVTASPLPSPSDSVFLQSVSAMSMAEAAPSIVLVGGHDGVSWLDSAEAFTPSTGAWNILPAMPAPRSFCAAAAGPDGATYIMGGGNGVDWYDSVSRLERGGTEWQSLAPLGVARGSLAAAFAQGYLYAFGGGKPKEQYSVVEWYDAQNDCWMPGPELSSRRFAVAGASLGGALYAVGGFNGEDYLASVERLDPREGRWTPVGSMLSQRGGHACTASGDNLLYALGGYFKGAIEACEVYDARQNAWRPIAALSDSRAYGAAAAAGETEAAGIFVAGGLRSDMQTHAPLMERYCPATNSWQQVELPAQANPRRSFLAVCTVG